MREAAVMLIVKDGLILGVSRRFDLKSFGLPGGKLEKGEPPIDAVIRETEEETKIIVTSCTYLFTRVEPAGTPDGFEFNTHCFYADTWEGEPARSEEGDVKWISKEELSKGSFPEYNLNALTIFHKLYPNISVS